MTTPVNQDALREAVQHLPSNVRGAICHLYAGLEAKKADGSTDNGALRNDALRAIRLLGGDKVSDILWPEETEGEAIPTSAHSWKVNRWGREQCSKCGSCSPLSRCFTLEEKYVEALKLIKDRPSHPGDECTCSVKSDEGKARLRAHAHECPARTELDADWCVARWQEAKVRARHGLPQV